MAKGRNLVVEGIEFSTGLGDCSRQRIHQRRNAGIE
jgi:hypothetical protein